VADIVLELPPGLPILSLNGRQHWAQRNRDTQAIKKAAWAKALAAKVPPLARVTITVEYQPPDRRRRDPDNLAPTGKAAIDGLVAAKVLPDDNSEHVTAVRYIIGEPYKLHPRGRIVIRVRELASDSNQEKWTT
jgi:crossover junction endodeoxyribonuclease RusA